MLLIICVFIIHWYLSIFLQTFFHHRYAAHKMFTMSKGWERFFFLASYLIQGSSYLSPKIYAILHRMHHAYTDTEEDPHSPSHTHNLFEMMWQTRHIYRGISHGKVEVEARFMKELPEWDLIDKIGGNYFSRIFWGLMYLAFYVAFAPSYWWFLLLPIHFLMGPVHGVIINWFSHTIGYRNFNTEDTSTNYLPFDFLTMGEGYHNNHHKYSSRPNFGGVRWHELDPTFWVIKLFNKLNIIQLRRAVV
ncbi:MAG: acyl-CoA desaturase [Bacteroidota bacterium]